MVMTWLSSNILVSVPAKSIHYGMQILHENWIHACWHHDETVLMQHHFWFDMSCLQGTHFPRHYQMTVTMALCAYVWLLTIPDNEVYWDNMGLSFQDGPHVGPMTLAIRDDTCKALINTLWWHHINVMGYLIIKNPHNCSTVWSALRQWKQHSVLLALCEGNPSVTRTAIRTTFPCPDTIMDKMASPNDNSSQEQHKSPDLQMLVTNLLLWMTIL